MFIFDIKYLSTILILCLVSINLLANPLLNVNSTASSLYKYSALTYDLNSLAKCEYFKNQAFNFCKHYSSLHDDRVACANANKQRWCECMGQSSNCYREPRFTW